MAEHDGEATCKFDEQNRNEGNASTTQTPESTPSLPAARDEDRSTLLQRARVFLTSPNVVHEDPATKRQFLIEKGLREDEINSLIRELPPQLPLVPPRTYPQLPPSNLPRILLGMTRILTWLTGSSAVLIFIYYRFLLPRITHSSLARRSLKHHQVSLLKQLNASLQELKSAQAETHTVLPAPRISYEPTEFGQIHDLEKLGINKEAPITVPEFTLLRCTIEGMNSATEGKKSTKEELFAFLEERYIWLKTDGGLVYQNSLWETLTTNPCFSEIKETDGNSERLVWIYTPPAPPEPTPLLTSLETLKSSFPPSRPAAQIPSPIQRTLDALADFTGYITTQTYQLTSAGFGSGSTTGFRYASSFSPSVQLSPQQEEVRKEIRALKGLVLNRRTFAPTAVRSTSFTSATSTT